MGGINSRFVPRIVKDLHYVIRVKTGAEQRELAETLQKLRSDVRVVSIEI